MSAGLGKGAKKACFGFVVVVVVGMWEWLKCAHVGWGNTRMEASTNHQLTTNQAKPNQTTHLGPLLRHHPLGQRAQPDGEEALGDEEEEEDAEPRDGREELEPHEREPLDAQLFGWLVR